MSNGTVAARILAAASLILSVMLAAFCYSVNDEIQANLSNVPLPSPKSDVEAAADGIVIIPITFVGMTIDTAMRILLIEMACLIVLPVCLCLAAISLWLIRRKPREYFAKLAPVLSVIIVAAVAISAMQPRKYPMTVRDGGSPKQAINNRPPSPRKSSPISSGSAKKPHR